MRADLLALTPESLAALANRGLVKRATREVEQAPPELSEAADGTVTGAFPDGVTTTLPTGGLEAGSCTCAATGVCRHLIGLVLAYRAAGSETDGTDEKPADEFVEWSPGAFTDDDLAARIGARLLTAARKAERAGYVARVRRPTSADPVPSVELSTATIRFLVPHDLGFVHTDAVAGTRDDVIALAVWAFREADGRDRGAPEVRLEVGGRSAGGDSGLAPALELADAVLRDGAVHSGPGRAVTVEAVRAGLDKAGLRWPLLAVNDLADQLAAYNARSARYDPAALAAVLGELHARHRAVTNRGAGLRSRVLGTEESAETPLRRARLVGLGARVLPGDGEERTIEVFLAHTDGGTVLVLRRPVPAGVDPGARRVAGVRLGALAGGNLVTEAAVRSASRTVRLATSRLAKHTVSPSAGAWHELPAELVVRDVTRLAADLEAMPPRLVRARVEAELVRAVAVGEVLSVGYSPGRQRLDAQVADPHGNVLTVVATHSAAAPGRLDALAAALAGAPSFVAGSVGRNAGAVWLDPLAVAVDGGVVVPDLAADTGTAELDGPSVTNTEPLAAALDLATGLLADAAHRGLGHLPESYPGRLTAAAKQLTKVGLRRAGEAVTTVAGTLGPDPGEAAISAWVDAYLRLSVTSDLR